MLKLYNTLTRKKEDFVPIHKGKVGMYVCGPTVYNYIHIGNLRAYVFGDILRKHLKFLGFKLTHVMNFTDVDDKTIRDSQKEKKSLKEFTKFYEKAFLEDIKQMNIEFPEKMPRATEHIKEMTAIIKKLLNKGIAYKTDGGIYFSISKFKKYGKLSGIKIEELKNKANERVANDEYEKENAKDFALWKFYDKSDGDVFWNTEIGKGRPGWHIECSAMSSKYLGQPFDIHAGGTDLIFPHHENEIAQSEAAFDRQFVKYWMHNEWVLVNGKKMSKSLGNFYKLKDITDKNYSALDLRYFFLTKIYRQQINFTFENLDNAKNAYERLKNICSEIKNDKKINEKYLKEFEKALNDDLNTPKALQVLWKLVRDKKANGKYQAINKIDKVFSLDLLKKEKVLINDNIKLLINEREEARKNKDWKKADEIRDRVNKLGYAINDTPEGVVVRENK